MQRAARLAKAKGAHDELIAKVHRPQADALEIEAATGAGSPTNTTRRRSGGEIRSDGERSFSAPEKVSGPAILPPEKLNEARIIRDALAPIFLSRESAYPSVSLASG